MWWWLTYNVLHAGITALPFRKLGFRHLSITPLYGYNGYLYFIPETEKECTEFRVESYADDLPPDFPKGGHFYYNNRAMAKLSRQLHVLELHKKGEEGWKERYERHLEVTHNSTSKA